MSEAPRILLFSYRLQVFVSAIIFGLIVLGAGVRIADAGLACPDWPLCFGEAIPTFNFQIFMEWIHRVIAMVVGILAFVVSLCVWSSRETRRRAGWLVLLSLFLFAIQALLGRQTVTELLHPAFVNAHLVGGYLLFAISVWISFRLSPKPIDLAGGEVSSSLKFILPLFLLITFFQATVGGTVSSNYAGLVCPDFPACQNGEWFPNGSALTIIKMAHRLAAFLLLFMSMALAFVSLRKNYPPQIRKVFSLAVALILFQIIVGIFMIFWRVPPGLSLLHSFLSISIFTNFLIGNLYVSRKKLS